MSPISFKMSVPFTCWVFTSNAFGMQGSFFSSVRRHVRPNGSRKTLYTSSYDHQPTG